MKKQSEYMSQAEVMRNLVLLKKGAMAIRIILAMKEFREGWDENDVRRWANQLRRKYQGLDYGYGQEAWIVYCNVVIGLEKLLKPEHRYKIHKRRIRTVGGHAEQTQIDGEIFKNKLKQRQIAHEDGLIAALDEENKALNIVTSMTTNVSDALKAHKKDFEEKEE